MNMCLDKARDDGMPRRVYYAVGTSRAGSANITDMADIADMAYPANPIVFYHNIAVLDNAPFSVHGYDGSVFDHYRRH